MSAYLLLSRETYVSEYYSAFRGKLNELDVYQPLVTDLKTLRQYRQNLAIATFLSDLGPSL